MARKLIALVLTLLVACCPLALCEAGDAQEADEFAAAGQADEFDPEEQLDETPEGVILSAMEVYAWFAVQPLDVDVDAPNEDGTRWRVLDERFNTVEGLDAMVRTYFSDEIADSLWAMGAYEEIDGDVYGTGEGRPMDERIADVTYEVAEQTDAKTVYAVHVAYLDDPDDPREDQTLLFTRELVDGAWLFTEFPFFW